MKDFLETIMLIIDKYGVEKAMEISNYVDANKQATKDDFIPDGIGDFGLNLNNPIPVFGLEGNEVYLEKLKTNDGNPIKWVREGSVISKNINLPVDKYKIFDSQNNFLTYLYISSYHWVISKKSPKGFVIEITG